MRWPLPIVVLLGGCTAANPAFDLDPTGTTANASITASGGDSDAGPSSTAAPDDGSIATGDGGSGDGGESESAGSTGDEAKPPEIGGSTWWLCEHGIGGLPPADHCAMVDDNGLRFEPETYVDQIWWANAPEVDCEGAPGRCFPANTPNPGPFDSAQWGKWTVDVLGPDTGVHVLLTGEACSGSLWFRHVAGQPYVEVTPGDDGGCELVGVDEPGIAPKGPWFMRRLP